MVLERFSGTLCVDEIHLGKYTLLLATDPLSDMPVAFALVSTNDQGHMRRFLKNLRTWGLQPRVVVSDDSPLYPKVLAELWPKAEHQLCVFHVLKNINKLVLDAVRRLRNGLARNGGRRKRRGRKIRCPNHPHDALCEPRFSTGTKCVRSWPRRSPAPPPCRCRPEATD